MFTHTTGPDSPLEALEVMRIVFGRFLAMYNASPEGKEAPKTGAYCSILTVEEAIAKTPAATVLFGELTRDLKIKYRHHCQEKACRLGEHVARGDVSSFQSADMETKFPGAVLLGNKILSCSGLPWEYDETVGLETGLDDNLNLAGVDVAIKIAKISNNRVFLDSFPLSPHA